MTGKTLIELNVKPGDVVYYHGPRWERGADRTVIAVSGRRVEMADGGSPAATEPYWQLVSRAAAPLDMAAIRAAVARAWCSPCNSHKEMDPDLAELAALEVAALLGIKPDREPREFWIVTYDGTAWDYEDRAKKRAASSQSPIIHVREVLE